MALRHQWHNQAQIELEETLFYVFREFGERSFEKVYAEVKQQVGQLCLFPDSGTHYKDLFYKGKEVKIVHIYQSSIIYYHDEETLFILAFGNNKKNDTDEMATLSDDQ